MADEVQFRHGTETFFIEGEGLLGEAGGGRPAEDGGPATESAAATAGAPAAVPPFRFSRVGPKGRPPSDAVMLKVAKAMIGPADAGSGTGAAVPAGYTYLGQFIDHDLTFDKTKVTLGQDISPADLLQGRSPVLDLDSLYGAGPQDPRSAKFYADDRHLLTGHAVGGGARQSKGFDVPRVGKGRRRLKIQANIPDLRNDENLAVGQTHAAMIRFHNRVVDKLPASVPSAQRFREARRKVVKHYQWMIRHDYLPRILEPAVVDDVFAGGRKVVQPNADPTSMPTMPVEFSVAAFRLGHSMVRASYAWNRNFPDEQGTLPLLFEFSGTSGDLSGADHLLSIWIADWRRLYDFPGDTGRSDLAAPAGQSNLARRIDTKLVNPLAHLPGGAFGDRSVPPNDNKANLAFRNLHRAGMVKLATGQQMAALLKEKGVSVKALTRAQILNGAKGAKVDALTAAEKDALVARTPLWFYILREAELNDGRLQGVGARIVAETMHRAMEGSRFSIVRDPAFRPSLGPDANTFRMADLLLFAFEGKKGLLNPVGG